MMKSKKNTKDEERQRDQELLEQESEAQILDELEQRLAELDSRYKRALADYQNFQRRAVENERRARTDAMAGVVEALIPVMDHFRLAMDVDPQQASAEQIFGGVKVILDELTKTLTGFGVAPIEPAPGDEFDPERHQAMMRAETEDVPPGCVVMLLQAGYALGDRVVRPAKVSVRPADEEAQERNDEPSHDAAEEE